MPIRINKSSLNSGKILHVGEISDIYEYIDDNGLIVPDKAYKISREDNGSNLLEKEFETINTILDNSDEKFRPLFHAAYDLQHLENHLVASEIEYKSDLVSMQQVLDAYPDGIDPKDVVWMWKRALIPLYLSHQSDLIHGSVIPPHILLDLDEHIAILVDWTASEDVGTKIENFHADYTDYYTFDALLEEPCNEFTDIYMLTMCIIKLLGGDLKTKTVPDSVPKELRAIIRASMMKDMNLTDASFIHSQIDKTIVNLWGPKVWRDFKLP